MKLHAMGIGYRHDENFRIFRPEGSGDNLLVIFRTPAFAVVGNVRVELPADSAVLYKKPPFRNTGRLVSSMSTTGCISSATKLIHSSGGLEYASGSRFSEFRRRREAYLSCSSLKAYQIRRKAVNAPDC